MKAMVSRPAPHMLSSIWPWLSPGSSPVQAGSSELRDMLEDTTWYLLVKHSPSGMTAEILPLSPRSPELQVMVSGAAGWPGRVTRPVTAPDAQPRSAPASRETPAAVSTVLRFMSGDDRRPARGEARRAPG